MCSPLLPSSDTIGNLVTHKRRRRRAALCRRATQKRESAVRDVHSTRRMLFHLRAESADFFRHHTRHISPHSYLTERTASLLVGHGTTGPTEAAAGPSLYAYLKRAAVVTRETTTTNVPTEEKRKKCGRRGRTAVCKTCWCCCCCCYRCRVLLRPAGDAAAASKSNQSDCG